MVFCWWTTRNLYPKISFRFQHTMGRGDAEARSGTPAGPSGSTVVPPTGVWRQVGLPVLVSGASVSCATACTNPLDVLKVRLQVLDPNRAGMSPRGMGDVLSTLLTNEGPLALWKGLAPSLARAMCYGGLRLGLYQPILGGVERLRGVEKRLEITDDGTENGSVDKTTTGTRRIAAVGRPGGAWEATGRGETKENSSTDFTSKVIAGSCSGAFAALLLNPTELVKTRLMARIGTPSSASTSNNSNALSVARGIIQTKGLSGLWRGAGMSVTRSAVLTASQCAAYDEAKKAVRQYTFSRDDDLVTHFLASMLTGLVTTTVTNPVDMIKTQLYLDSGSNPTNRGGGGGSTSASASAGVSTTAGGVKTTGRNGALAAAKRVLRKEGPRGFMRGWSANYCRLGPQTVITFVALEQFRKLGGMNAL